MDKNFSTDEEGYGCYKGYRIGMIDKLPGLKKNPTLEEDGEDLYEKTQELIDKVNELEVYDTIFERPRDPD